MRILVTGGAGFIGSHVAEYFQKDNEVLIIDNLSREEILGKGIGSKSYNLNYLKGFKNISFYNCDIRDFEKVKEIGKGIDAIIHTAAQVAVTTSLKNPRLDFEINALGTFNMLELARLNDASLIFCSTNKVYGENVNKIPLLEKNSRYEYADERFIEGIPEDFSIDLTGHSPYGCSKLAADIYVQDYAYTYGLKTGVFRMSCIYGERQFGVEDQGWVAWFVIATEMERKITIYGNGKQVRDLLYVKDLVELYDKFLSSNIRHGVFNAGGGRNNAYSLLEVIDMIRKILNKKPDLNYSDWRPADQKVYISNIRKAHELLNWYPRTSAEEGIKKLALWVRNNRQLFIGL
ncbi:MAG TPA: GDP-mannose 4,6-dehydratase [Geobacterales bacterium]|nr:GDP-mannose 4,6-dehydratase [Geobacterales bacterium]